MFKKKKHIPPPGAEYKNMIEINKKAKPYNPVETLLGTALLSQFPRAQYVGMCHYGTNYQGHKEVLILCHSYNRADTALKNAGWVFHHQPIPYDVNLNHIVTYRKGNDFAYVTADRKIYHKWSNAAEVCRVLGLPADGKGYEVAKSIFEIIMKGLMVHMLNEGTYELKPMIPENVPLDGGGYANVNWAAGLLAEGGLAEANLAPVPEEQIAEGPNA